MVKKNKPLELSPEDQKEMNEALEGLKENIDPGKILEMFSGFQEGMEIATQSLTIAKIQNSTLIGIHNILIEIRDLLRIRP